MHLHYYSVAFFLIIVEGVTGFKRLSGNCFQGLAKAVFAHTVDAYDARNAASNGHGWLPVISLSSFNKREPMQVEIGGFKYVIWKSPKATTSEGWNVMDDACPHRFAPMSEGRVDAVSGCIECPYHGWQFESQTGLCSSIPQQSDFCKKATVAQQKSTALRTYPVHITGDLLWAYLPIVGSNVSFPTLPEDLIPDYLDPQRRVSFRDIGYSFDMAIENLMDASHVPFAHHTLQGSRSDATTVITKPMSDLNNGSYITISFQDRTRGKFREGTSVFVPPAHFYFQDNHTATGSLATKVLIACAPISPGKTRIFLTLPFPRSRLLSLIPVWLMHAFSMTFLDSDVWVADAEHFIRAPQNAFLTTPTSVSTTESDILLGARANSTPRYAMVTPADQGVVHWRKWWRRHLSRIPMFAPAPPTLQRLDSRTRRDRYEDHIRYCKHCQGGLRHAQQMQTLAPLLSLGLIAIARTVVERIAGVVVFGVLQTISQWIVRTIEGKKRLEPLTVARKEVRK